MDINHLSVSRKKTYDQCEQKYKFQYHLKVKPPGPEPVYFIYGNIVHKIAELFVQNRGLIPIGDLANDIIRGKILVKDRPAPALPDEYRKKLQKHLRAIQNLTDRVGTGGIVEHEFKYDMDPPHGRCVTGFIDRLIVKDGKAFIIDYKTTKKGKGQVTPADVRDDLQLRMYSRVVQRDFGMDPANIKAALYYLEGENLVAAQYSEADLLATEIDMLNTYKRIETADPDKVWGRVGWSCKWCDFHPICPFYQGSTSAAPLQTWDGNMSALGHAADPWAS